MPEFSHLKAFLFDLDGTLINSMAAVDRAWTEFAGRNDLDVKMVLNLIHGRPASQSVNQLLSHADEATRQKELDWIVKKESNDVEGIVPISGALEFLDRLDALALPWGIVTSGSMTVATRRMKATGVRKPEKLVTADQIKRGKPDPEPYLLGASQLGFSPQDCAIFEDAPAGFESARAAGGKVVAVDACNTNHDLGALPFIREYQQIDIVKQGDSFTLIVNR